MNPGTVATVPYNGLLRFTASALPLALLYRRPHSNSRLTRRFELPPVDAGTHPLIYIGEADWGLEPRKQDAEYGRQNRVHK